MISFVKAEDRIGQVINDWKITEIVGRTSRHVAIFRFENINTHIVNDSTFGNFVRRKNFSIGYNFISWSNGRLRDIWHLMKHRCYNVNDYKNYKHYGARGIGICDEWLDNPKAFEEWALESGYQDGLTIDRINVNEGYNPNNCRWISRSENAKWTRRTKHIWIGNYCDSQSGWSLKVQKHSTWFNRVKKYHNYDYAYQRLLEEIEKLGGIKKVLGISEEEPDISHILEDISNDCLED